MLENESSSSGMDNHTLWRHSNCTLYKLVKKTELYVLSGVGMQKVRAKCAHWKTQVALKKVVLFVVRLALSSIHGCCGSHGPGPGCTSGLRTSGSFSSSSCTSPSTAT